MPRPSRKSGTRTVQITFKPGKQDKVRAKNSKAQKKYRQRKQDERRQLEALTQNLAEEVSTAEAQRNALACTVADLELQLDSSHKLDVQQQDKEPIYIPAVDGYGNLRAGERPGLMLRAVYSPPKRWTYAEAMALSVREFALMRKDIVLAAGQLLLNHPQSDERSPAGKQMKELMKESHGITAYLALHCPKILSMLVECRMDASDAPAPSPPAEFWPNIVRHLQLTADQEGALLKHYMQMRDTQRRLFAEREQICQALVSHIDSCDYLPVLTNGAHHSLDCLHWASLVRRLQENADNQHVAKSKFNVRCTCLWTMEDEFGPDQQGIGVFQDARLLTLAWPYFPKVNYCIEAIAKRYGLLEKADAQDRASVAELVKVDDSDEKPYVSPCTKLIEEYMQSRFRLD